jgi:hypothetical protein
MVQEVETEDHSLGNLSSMITYFTPWLAPDEGHMPV